VPGRAPGYYPAAVVLAGRDVQGQDVELNPGMTIQVVYKANPGKVRGTVEEGEGATVLLWPLRIAFPDIVPTVQAGARGAFEFSNVPPGDYSVVAFDRIPQQGAPEAFASTLVGRGTRVSVQEGSVESVQLALMQWAN
jgi:hypothetical protein